MNGITEGRIVHYVLPNGEHRPAIMVKTDLGDWGYPSDTVQLQVFLDGTNDQIDNKSIRPEDATRGLMWATSVVHDEETKEPYTWHWIERA